MARTEKRQKPPRLPREVVDAVAAAEDKKAVDITLLDLRKAAGFADYFLICSGTNVRQIRAIADAIIEALASSGSKPAHVEGYDRSEWILLDYFDFIVHIFAPEPRVFYGLERLWGNAERVELQTPTPMHQSTAADTHPFTIDNR
jgi:ribosome-associated protein